jgi:hypothetical protein
MFASLLDIFGFVIQKPPQHLQSIYGVTVHEEDSTLSQGNTPMLLPATDGGAVCSD